MLYLGDHLSPDDITEELSDCEQCAAAAAAAAAGAGDEDGRGDGESPTSECTPYQPPEYHSLLRQKPTNTGSPANSGSRHMSSFKPQRTASSVGTAAAGGGNNNKKSVGLDAAAAGPSPDHIPRSHERLPYRPASHDSVPPSAALYVPEPQHDSPAATDLGTSESPPPLPSRNPTNNSSIAAENSSGIRNSPSVGARYNPTLSPSIGARCYDSAGSYDRSAGGAHYDSRHPHFARQYDAVPPEHYEQLQQDIIESEHSQQNNSSSSSSRSKRHRQRRKPRSHNNTDLSSNGKSVMYQHIPATQCEHAHGFAHTATQCVHVHGFAHTAAYTYSTNVLHVGTVF